MAENANPDTAATHRIDVAGTDVAYRAIGAEMGVPLVLLQRFRGTRDDWDPAFLEALASRRNRMPALGAPLSLR